jgi:hypothetical protein
MSRSANLKSNPQSTWGFIIDTEKRGLCMDPQKIEAITNWKAPTSVKGVRSFLGFANTDRGN